MARDMTPRQVAEAWLAAWNAHDADAAAALMADDVTYFDVTVGEPQKGRDAARDKVIKLFVTAAPDLTWKMSSEPIESADGIAFEWTFGGTNTGAWAPDTQDRQAVQLQRSDLHAGQKRQDCYSERLL